jgi:hypothetical protein
MNFTNILSIQVYSAFKRGNQPTRIRVDPQNFCFLSFAWYVKDVCGMWLLCDTRVCLIELEQSLDTRNFEQFQHA